MPSQTQFLRGGLTGRFEHPSAHGPALDAWALRKLLAGWSPRAVVAAVDGRITVRTAYRWRAAVLSVETLRVGAWEADYAIRRNAPPARISAWRCGEKLSLEGDHR